MGFRVLCWLLADLSSVAISIKEDTLNYNSKIPNMILRHIPQLRGIGVSRIVPRKFTELERQVEDLGCDIVAKDIFRWVVTVMGAL